MSELAKCERVPQQQSRLNPRPANHRQFIRKPMDATRSHLLHGSRPRVVHDDLQSGFPRLREYGTTEIVSFRSGRYFVSGERGQSRTVCRIHYADRPLVNGLPEFKDVPFDEPPSLIRRLRAYYLFDDT